METLTLNQINIEFLFSENLSKIKNLFKFRKISFSNFVLKRLQTITIKEFTTLYVQIVGLKVIFENLNAKQSKIELGKINILINKIIKIQSQLENINYYENNNIESIVFDCITGLYEIDTILRKNARTLFERIPTEEGLKKELSKKSLSALQNVSL